MIHKAHSSILNLQNTTCLFHAHSARLTCELVGACQQRAEISDDARGAGGCDGGATCGGSCSVSSVAPMLGRADAVGAAQLSATLLLLFARCGVGNSLIVRFSNYTRAEPVSIVRNYTGQSFFRTMK